MKIMIVSDLHANIEALSALPSDFDELFVLGDLVNYGPNPREVIQFVRENATLVVRGNHDHAIGFGTDPRCSWPYKAMAAEMARITQGLVSDKDRAFLRSLPLTIVTENHGARFHLCHATPSHPLYAYCPPDAAEWETEAHGVAPGFLLVGHTHLQFRREISGRTIVNPGSVGQPKSGAPSASFAIWDNGELTLRSVPYDFEQTADKIQKLDLPSCVKWDLIEVLHRGALCDRDAATTLI